jgi:hypothetical protein
MLLRKKSELQATLPLAKMEKVGACELTLTPLSRGDGKGYKERPEFVHRQFCRDS